MKPVGASLQTLIESGNFVDFDAYTLALQSGPTLRYTTCDIDIRDGATVWSAHQVRIEDTPYRGHWKNDLSPDTWQAIFAPRSSDLLTGAAYPDQIGSTAFLAAVQAGALDNAVLTVERAYFATAPAYPEPAQISGRFTVFSGPVGAVDIGRTATAITASSNAILLQTNLPRNMFQSQCSHALFDAGCTLNPNSFLRAATALTGSTQSTILSAVAAPPGSATYSLGQVRMTSGLNAGFWRSVKSWTSGTFKLLLPFPYAVAAGDTFNAIAGCDLTQASCALFGNTVNFGGEPFIPVPETVV